MCHKDEGDIGSTHFDKTLQKEKGGSTTIGRR